MSNAPWAGRFDCLAAMVDFIFNLGAGRGGARLAAPQCLYTTTAGLLAFDADGTGGTAAINLVTLLEQPGTTAANLLVGGW